MLRLTLLLLTVLISSDTPANKSMVVTATAYNAIPSQTSAVHHDITAWGDRLEPGMKCIAVSRDLIPLGLRHNTRVTIEGFEGYYLVKDKMNKRWTQRIDIYMGNDIQAARQWGIRQVRITWDEHE